MKMLDTPHKKKSAGLTAVIGVLLLILFFLLGLTYYDPPISYGMEVNFGTLAEGSGKVQPQKKVQAIEKVKEKVVEVEEKVESEPPKQITEESVKEVLTEEKSTVVVTEKKESSEVVKPITEKLESEAQDEPVEEKPKVSEATKSVVSSLLKNKAEKGEEIEGDGDYAVQGDKGKIE